jgi:hypothetical protein
MDGSEDNHLSNGGRPEPPWLQRLRDYREGFDLVFPMFALVSAFGAVMAIIFVPALQTQQTVGGTAGALLGLAGVLWRARRR